MLEINTQKELKVTVSLRAEYAAAPGDMFVAGEIVYPMDREQFGMFEIALMEMFKGLGLAEMERMKGAAGKNTR